MTAGRFRYESFELEGSTVTCRYSLDEWKFEERVQFDRPLRVDDPALQAAARLIFLLAGVSYYKTFAPPIIDFGVHALSDQERGFLRDFYVEGLGEYAYSNEMQLDFEIVASSRQPESAGYQPQQGRPLVPFGGGIDSIVSVEQVRSKTEDAALFIVSQGEVRFDAIESPARVTGLPVVRATRLIDPQVLRSRQLGFLNGHIPVTGILSAIAVTSAVLTGRDAVVMSNERSASVPTLTVDGVGINHQYSKSWDFERAFRELVQANVGAGLDYFSLLRPYSEIWVAQRFAQLTQYHGAFRSCNRAFHIDPAARLDHWCGHCDKCCFIDLVLAPFLTPAELGQVFTGNEPLRNPTLAEKFRALLGLVVDAKPFECVGDIDECRGALVLAAQRADRADDDLLQQLRSELAVDGSDTPAGLLAATPPDAIPDEYSPESLVV